MNVDKLKDRKHLHNSDFDKDGTSLVMQSMEQQELGQEKDLKWILFFEGQKKGLALNVINTKRIASQCGQDTDDWWGKSITLYATKTQVGEEIKGCIRVKVEGLEEEIPF